MKVYLDNCCFNRPFDDQTQLRVRLESEAKLNVQDEIRAGKLALIWSYMLDYENDENPFLERRDRISKWKGLASIVVGSSDEVFFLAKDFQKLGIKNKDSLHLACALHGGAERFLTTDDRLRKKRDLIPSLNIENPVEFAINENGDD